ncbi:hypothetical protein DERF_011947 [Dermatophagoides farinae]|uniref:Uncharacterized protein n=1 Tax=Dermatophagoides farinae TaxID=6954 RepID=A0A922L310_DERFA|nr:hypothetical protein DERF_011947 [Dermatophagoides farinae]
MDTCDVYHHTTSYRSHHNHHDNDDDDDDDEISIVNIFKYMLICTLSLLIIGLITLFIRHLFLVQNSNDDDLIIILLGSYLATFIITLVTLLATFKEHFFFLITAASLNLILATLSMAIQSYRWSIILLQIISSLFTFSYLLSMYLKMKLEIIHKRRLQKRFLEELQTSNMMKRRFLGFNPIELTNEWIINHNHNDHDHNSIMSTDTKQQQQQQQNQKESAFIDSERIITTTPMNTI